MFRTAYDKFDKEYSPAGNEIEPIYEYQINKAGQKQLVKTGERNIRDEINSHLEDSLLENQIARAIAGDNSVFNANCIYTDTTEYPKNMIEAQNKIQELNNIWEKLPSETKNKYNRDLNEFITKAGTKEWCEDMGLEYIKEEKINLPEAPQAEIMGQIKESEVKNE